MKKPVFTKTTFTIPKELEAQIKNATTQKDIDNSQDKQIAALYKVDEKHDKQFAVSMLIDMLYIIWLTALTGYMAFNK